MDVRETASSSTTATTDTSAANPRAHEAEASGATSVASAAPVDATPSKKRKGAGGSSIPISAEDHPAVTGKSCVRERLLPSLLQCVVPPGVDNPILAALGGTPRSSSASASDLPEPELLDLNDSSSVDNMTPSEESIAGAASSHSAASNPLGNSHCWTMSGCNPSRTE